MTIEDIYASGGDLQDFWNEVFALECQLGIYRRKGLGMVSLDEVREQIKNDPLQTVERRYLQLGGQMYRGEDNPGIQTWRGVIAKHPLKVARLNQCVAAINRCQSLEEIYIAVNEIHRLLYGKKSEYIFREDLYHPEKFKP